MDNYEHPYLLEARRWAKKFLERWDEYARVCKDGPPGTNPREAAALKRTSMDLSRALSKWRQRNVRRPGT